MSITDSSTRSIQVVSGAAGVTFTAPNKFTLQLPASGFRTGKDECALKSLTMYYSWPNISPAQGNNAFSYKWNGVEYPVVMEAGIYDFTDVQDYLEQVMVQNGHFLINASGNRVFYIAIIPNPVLYCLSLVVTPVPSVLPAQWTNPAAVVLNGLCPQLVIPANMTLLTGFAAGTYPTAQQSTVYRHNSGIPQITGVTALNVTSNMVTNSGLSLYSDVLASFVVPNDQLPGSPIHIEPINPDWVPVQKAATLTTIEVEIKDQLMRPVVLRDPAGFVCTISVRRVK